MSLPCCINKTNGRPIYPLEQPVGTKSYTNFRTFFRKCRLVPFFSRKKPVFRFALCPVSMRVHHEYPRRYSPFQGSLGDASPDIRRKFRFRRAYLVLLGRCLTLFRSYFASSTKCFLWARCPHRTSCPCGYIPVGLMRSLFAYRQAFSAPADLLQEDVQIANDLMCNCVLHASTLQQPPLRPRQCHNVPD